VATGRGMKLEAARACRDQSPGLGNGGVVSPDVELNERNEHVRMPRGRLQHLVVAYRTRPRAARAAHIDAPHRTGNLALAVIVSRLVGCLVADAAALRHPRQRVVSRRPGRWRVSLACTIRLRR